MIVAFVGAQVGPQSYERQMARSRNRVSDRTQRTWRFQPARYSIRRQQHDLGEGLNQNHTTPSLAGSTTTSTLGILQPNWKTSDKLGSFFQLFIQRRREGLRERKRTGSY